MATIEEIEDAIAGYLTPDYNHYKRMEYWTLSEACSLLADLKPTDKRTITSDRAVSFIEMLLFPPFEETEKNKRIIERWVDEKKNDCLEIENLAYRALDSYETGFTSQPPFKFVRMNNGLPDHLDYPSPLGLEDIPPSDYIRISPPDFLSWAFEKGFLVPEPLGELITDKESSLLPLPIMAKDTPYYPEELEMAMAAWTDLYENGKIKKNKGYKDQIRKWLKEHYPKASNAAIERIVIVVNPNKKGGAPSTN